MSKFFSEDVYLTYDDVLIYPGKSLPSRYDAILSNIIIPAPMDTISGPELVSKQVASVGIGILHRYLTVEEKIDAWRKTIVPWGGALFIGIGVDWKEINQLLQAGITNYCIDVANGYSDKVIEIIKGIKQVYPAALIIAGNIATPEAFGELWRAGADYIRVGIGGGSLCTTRLVTGVGVPNLSCLLDLNEYWWGASIPTGMNYNSKRPKIIADGGIRNSGDAVKALVAGADYVMLGNVLSGCDETPGEAINGYKEFRGMASLEAQTDFYGKEPICPEGVTTKVKCKGPYEKILANMLAGIKSGMSYVNARNINELRANAKFIRITNNSLLENKPHNPFYQANQ